MKKQAIKEKLRIDIRKEYPELFERLRGHDTSAQHRFHDGDGSNIILAFENDVVLESWDEGKSWYAYGGNKTWPHVQRGIFRFDDELVGLNGMQLWRSYDNGCRWHGPETIPFPDDTHVRGLGMPNCFSAIKTFDGKLVLVSDNFLGQEGPAGQLISSRVSEDRGKTWTTGRLFKPADPLPNGPEGFGEPAVVEMSPGWLWMVMRTLYGELWQCISRDGGYTWTDPTPTGLVSPIANCYAYKHPDSGAVVLSWNMTQPGLYTDFKSRHSIYRPRTNLVFAVSHDRCRTWSCPVTVEEKGGFYPTIYFSAENMFIMYQSAGDEESQPWHKHGLTIVSYDRQEVDNLPAWTTETIQPYIKAGLVRHWLAINCDKKESIS